MEITLLSKNSLKIKGKRASFVVDPSSSAKASADRQEKGIYAAALVLAAPSDELLVNPEAVLIEGPGEYELGGIKMNASRTEGDVVYNPVVDGVEILLGKFSSLDRLQHKLKEQNIIAVYADSVKNASFLTSLATNVIIFYGEHAQELASSLGKESIKSMPKYSATADKLPQEVESIILE